MNQVSRPMQIALAAVLVFAALWFGVLRPKTAAVEPVAATPATPVATTPPRADAGGAAAETAVGKAIETAKNGAAGADAAVKSREAQTGDSSPSTPVASTPAKAPVKTTPAAPAATTPASTTPVKAAPAAAKPAAKDEPKVSAAQERANDVVLEVERDLKARKAVVLLVWDKAHGEDRLMQTRVTKKINKRGGRVTVYLIPVSQVGLYDGLLSGLSVAQTPSTIVIAPNNEAKVLGGLASTERLNRLTSAATLTKPVEK